MARRMRQRGAPATVSSAGLLEGGRTSPPEIVELLGGIGVDMTARTSRQLQVDALESADLVLTMERAHVRAIALMAPTAWPKTFTLKEIVRRGTLAGQIGEDEAIEEWTARVQADRAPSALLGGSESDDVADPYGGTAAEYRSTLHEIDGLVTAVAELIWPQPHVSPEGASVSAPWLRRSRFSLARRS